jgi:NAD(P)-dependent dehydrogenase (short-subunit alcohol dehydrogenase family)
VDGTGTTQAIAKRIISGTPLGRAAAPEEMAEAAAWLLERPRLVRNWRRRASDLRRRRLSRRRGIKNRAGVYEALGLRYR